MDDQSDDTAPVTAAVTAPVPQPAPVSIPLPFDMSIPDAYALARDLAINMYDTPVILSKHNLDVVRLAVLNQNPYFQKLLEQAAREWNSPRSVNERLALESAVALEGTIPTITARMKITNEPLSGVVEAGKLLAKIAGAGEQKIQQAPGEKFSITINLGADTKLQFEKHRTIDVTAQGTVAPSGGSLPDFTEGDGSSPPL